MPPDSKKLSVVPIASTSKTSAKISHNCSSKGVLGLDEMYPLLVPIKSGSGSLLVSSLPLAFNGIDSILIIDDGIM